MSIEIQMLAAVSGLLLVLTLLQGTRNVLVLGLPTAAGNQHDIPAWEGVHDRLNRAIRNLIEGIAIFAPVVVAVHLSGTSNETTALGAQIFVVARIAHAAVYTAGIPWVRTTAWAVGVAGIVMVASPFIG